jgi:hypothetical protein
MATIMTNGSAMANPYLPRLLESTSALSSPACLSCPDRNP